MELLKRTAAWFHATKDPQPEEMQPEKQRQPAPFPLLQLTPELILYISDFLDPASRVLASQTCHALRAILGGTRLSYSQYLDYLTALSRTSSCDEWVCEVCMVIHPIYKREKPTPRWYSPCIAPLLKRAPWRDKGRWICKLRTDYNDSIFNFLLDHGYVQLALRIVRLGNSGFITHHRQLIACHHGRFFPYWADMLDHTQNVHQKLNPRIVQAADGELRYLLMTSWFQRADPTSQTLAYEDVADILACPHQQVQQKKLKRNERCMLAKASDIAFEHRAQELRGACFSCRTDYTVFVALDGMSFELHIWQDLGTEDSPMDPSWGNHITKYSRGLRKAPRRLFPDWHPDPPTLHTKPGSIRELYYRNSEAKGGAFGIGVPFIWVT